MNDSYGYIPLFTRMERERKEGESLGTVLYRHYSSIHGLNIPIAMDEKKSSLGEQR